MTLISIPPTGSKQISFIEGVIIDHLADSELPIVIANDLTVTGTLNVAGPLQLGSTININADGIAESATRKYLGTGAQTILGAKTFSNAATFSSGLTTTSLTVNGDVPYLYSAGYFSSVASTIGAGGISKNIQAYIHNSNNDHTVTLPDMDTISNGHCIKLYSTSLPGKLFVKTFTTTDLFYDANNRVFITGTSFTIPENTACEAFFSRSVNGWVISIPCPFVAPTFSNPTLTGDISAGILQVNSTGVTLINGTSDFGNWSFWNGESATGFDSLHGGLSHFGGVISGAKSGNLALHITANDVSDCFFISTNTNFANYVANRKLFQVRNSGDLNFGTAGEVTWTQATKTLSLASDSTLTVPVGKLKLGTVTLTATATELNLLSGVTALHNPLIPKRAPGVYLTSGPTYTVDLANAPECIWCDSTSSIDIVIPEITLSTYGGWRIRIVNTGSGTVWVRFYNADIQHAGGSKTFRGGTPAYSSLTVGNTHGYVLTYNGATTTLEKTYYSQYMHAT